MGHLDSLLSICQSFLCHAYFLNRNVDQQGKSLITFSHLLNSTLTYIYINQSVFIDFLKVHFILTPLELICEPKTICIRFVSYR